MLSLVLVAVVMVMCALGAVSWLSRQDTYEPLDEYGQYEDEHAIDEPAWDFGWAELDGVQLSWSMPLVDEVDGPGALDAIELPALGTTWVSEPTAQGLEHRATLLQDLGDLGADADTRARSAIAALHADGVEQSEPIGGRSSNRMASVHDDVSEFEVRRVAGDTVFLGRALAWDEHVLLLEVGRPADRLDLEGQATYDLGRMTQSIDATGP